MYNAMVLPLFDYGDIFFHHAGNRCLVNRLQTLQNSAIRMICKLPKRSSVTNEHISLKLLTLEERRNLHSIQFAYFLSTFHWNIQQNPGISVLTRALNPNRRQLKLFTPRKAIVERSFSFQTRKMWNNLPDAIHLASDKKAVTSLLLNNSDLIK